ncbi:E3 ubiquitin-protein ligase rnf152 [Hemiscyllium ocellatum]|uniref:E3 ubiquitin-protein ligase rnf152 n=1 Tax=Hemiscyllium ocellatum TaxID=170820 RepID=UPI002965DD54|nr:E3 ubiquitin-protein ligase rnf152 [Hemiscyllium ocellatum]XP_060705882.1 E3 ubiquitin-protein ligase rnf152 [Hemiscyllium ocellatum]
METVSQDSQMECQICFNYYSPHRRPKQLDCKHTCCSVCLQQMRSSQKELMCPWCRSVTKLSPSLSVSQLPDDPEIITVISIPHTSERTPVFIRLPTSGCYMVPLTVTKENALLPGEGSCRLLPGNQRKAVTAVLIPGDQQQQQQVPRQHQVPHGPREDQEEEEGQDGVKTSTCSGVCTVLLVACVLLFLLGIVLHNMSCISKRFTAISCG